MNSKENDKIIITNDNVTDDRNTIITANTNTIINDNSNDKGINQIENNNNCNNNNSKAKNTNTSNSSNSQRIVALIGVALLVVVIIALLLTAIFDPTGVWFRACLVLVIALPILLWIYVWLYGMLKQKKTIASFEFLEDAGKEENSNKQEKMSNNT